MDRAHIVQTLKSIPRCVIKKRELLVVVFYVREDFPICAYDTTICGWIGLGECFTGSRDVRREIYDALGITEPNTVLSFEDLCRVVDNGNITCLLNGEENA